MSQPREWWRTDLVYLGVSRLDLGPNLAASTQALYSLNRERGAWHQFKSIVLPGVESNRHHIVRILLICKYTDTSGLFVQLEKWQNAKHALLSPPLDILSEKLLFSLWCPPRIDGSKPHHSLKKTHRVCFLSNIKTCIFM